MESVTVNPLVCFVAAIDAATTGFLQSLIHCCIWFLNFCLHDRTRRCRPPGVCCAAINVIQHSRTNNLATVCSNQMSKKQTTFQATCFKPVVQFVDDTNNKRDTAYEPSPLESLGSPLFQPSQFAGVPAFVNIDCR